MILSAGKAFFNKEILAAGIVMYLRSRVSRRVSLRSGARTVTPVLDRIRCLSLINDASGLRSRQGMTTSAVSM